MHATQSARGPVSLREVLPQAQFFGREDFIAASCAGDWRVCRPGDVFFALTTADDDGHERASEAIERGAAAVVAERLLPVEVPQVLVHDSRAALAQVCQALAGNPSHELRTIGIAGSAGKTVTAMLLASIFEADGEAVGVMSSLGHSDSLVQQSAIGTAPSAPEFASWLARMQVAGCQSAVLELSSQVLAEQRTSGIELDAAILMNLQCVEYGDHNTPGAYQRIIRRVFDHLKPGGLAVVNADDHRCSRLIPEIASGCLTFGVHAEADVTASVLERFPSEQTFLLSVGSETAPVRTRMIGDQHVVNCLAAATAALAAGIELETIVRGLEAVDRVPGRMERLECGQPFSVFVDSSHSSSTLTLAIKSLRQATQGRVFVVFGPDGKSAAPRLALLGRALERGAHVPIITCDEPGHRKVPQMAHDVLDGFTRPHKAQIIPNRQAAIQFALDQAQPGDAVLIAGRGDRVTPAAGQGEHPYDDREVTCQYLFGQPEQPATRARFRVFG